MLHAQVLRNDQKSFFGNELNLYGGVTYLDARLYR